MLHKIFLSLAGYSDLFAENWPDNSSLSTHLKVDGPLAHLYDQYREELLTKARNCINEWDNLSNCDKLSTLFTELPRSLGKYVKKSFISRRRTIFK